MPLTPEQRRARARIAANARWSREDPVAFAHRGQEALVERFRRDIVAEHGPIAEPELTRRALARRNEHLARLRLQASKARTGGDA